MTNLSPHFTQNRQQNSGVSDKIQPQQCNIQIRGVTIKTKKKPSPPPTSKTKPDPAAAPTQERERISARELHKYVIGSLGIFMLFAIGYSSALYRLDRSEPLVPLMSELEYSIDG